MVAILTPLLNLNYCAARCADHGGKRKKNTGRKYDAVAFWMR